jgi:cysteine dioxygenase type I
VLYPRVCARFRPISKDFLSVTLDVVPDITMHGHDDPYRRAIADRPPTVGRLAALVHDHTVRPEDWWHLVRFDPAAPVRTPLNGAAGIELWLTAWPPGYRTEPYDHDSGQVITLIAGELSDVTIGPHGATERRLPVGRVRVHGAGRVRELVNPAAAFAVTLHARPVA